MSTRPNRNSYMMGGISKTPPSAVNIYSAFESWSWIASAAVRNDWKLPPPSRRRTAHNNRRADVTLPDSPVVELDTHAVRRIDGTHVTSIDPNPAGGRVEVGPGPERVAR